MRLFNHLSPLAIVGISTMLAQLSPVIDPSMATLIGNVGTIAVLVWYVVYDVRVRTPAMLAAFDKEQSESRKANETAQAALRESYRTVIEGMRSTFSAEQAATRQAFAADQAAVRTQYDREFSELRAMLYETMKSMRTAVHDVRDTAQECLTKVSVSAKKAALKPT